MRIVGNMAGVGPLYQVIMDTVAFVRLIELTDARESGVPTWFEVKEIGVGKVEISTYDPNWFETFNRQVQDGSRRR